MDVAHQVCILYAVVNGYLANVSVEKIPEFELRLREFMDDQYADVLQAIRTTGKLEADAETRLKEALTQLLAEVHG